MQLHQVIQDVREIHWRIVNSQYFYGYSAAARFAGGVLALLSAVILNLFFRESSTAAHLIAWSTVFVLAGAANYFMLCSRLKFSRTELLSDAVLQPLLLLITGGLITLALVSGEFYEILFGVWFSLFGLANISPRQNFSRQVVWVGYFYLAAGWIYLLALPWQDFQNPWPMGVIFFAGETLGACAFLHHNRLADNESDV